MEHGFWTIGVLFDGPVTCWRMLEDGGFGVLFERIPFLDDSEKRIR